MDPSPTTSDSPASGWITFRMHVYRYGVLLRRRWWILLLTMAAGLAASLLYVRQLPPSFLSAGRMMVSGKINLPDGAGSVAYSEELMNFFGTQIELMKSGEVQNRALARVQATHPEIPPVKIKLAVEQQPKTSMFVFRATSPEPTFSQAYVDGCMEEYVRMKKEMRSEKSLTTVTALSSELASIEKEKVVAEDEILDFQRKNNLGYMKEEGNSAALYLTSLNRQLADFKTEYQLLQLLNLDQNVDRRPAASTEPADAARETPLDNLSSIADYAKARQQLQLLRAEREQLSRYMKPKHPDIVRLDEEISRQEILIKALREQGTEQIKNRRDALVVQMENLEKVIAEWEKKALDLSERLGQYQKLQSKADRLKSQYDRLFGSLRGVDVNRTVDQDMVSILEHASPPVSVEPGLPKAIAAGLGLGLLLGLGILFMLDRIDDRIRSTLELQTHFVDQLLGQISREEHPDGTLPLLRANDPRQRLAESFRSLRSALHYMPVDGPRPKAFLITSAVPAEGKSTVSANLAITLALSGARTLLVDCDLRRGQQHRAFGLPNKQGATEILESRLHWSEAVLDTGVENLSLLPRGGGTDQPGERFLSPVADRFLREVYAAYDYLIFDSAPVLVADDTGSLAPKIDAVICVIRFGQSSTRLSRQTVDELKHRQANVIGLVLNDVDVTTPDYSYKYSSYEASTGEAELARQRNVAD